MLFARLLTVIDGCVVAEPTRRLTVPLVLELLTTLQRDVAAAAPPTEAGVGVSSGGGAAAAAATSPVALLPTYGAVTPAYDVLAIVSAMEALSIDAGAVIDAIGGMSTSSLDALRGAGLPYVKCLAVKKALADTGPAAEPVKVGTITPCGHCHGVQDDAFGGAACEAQCGVVCERFWLVCVSVVPHTPPLLPQLSVGAVFEELMAQGYDDDKTEALGGHIGFADVVTVEQLAAAGVPNRTVFDIRRRLDPVAAAAQVLGLYIHAL